MGAFQFRQCPLPVQEPVVAALESQLLGLSVIALLLQIPGVRLVLTNLGRQLRLVRPLGRFGLAEGGYRVLVLGDTDGIHLSLADLAASCRAASEVGHSARL